MGKFKEISIEQDNLLNMRGLQLRKLDIDLDKTYIENENEKISLKEYINVTDKRIYLIAPKDKLHLWGWTDFRKKLMEDY